jgi:hypothetical protein
MSVNVFKKERARPEMCIIVRERESECERQR